MRCLAKSPDQRWASAEALLAALQRRSLPAAPPLPPGTGGPAAAPPRRATLLVGVVLALLIGAGFLLPWLTRSATPARGAPVGGAPVRADSVSASVTQRFALRPSEVAGCRLRSAGDTTELTDDAVGDNCWWQATPTLALRSPLSYVVDFRVTRDPGARAGLGLAWCRTDADCRVTFLWQGSPAWSGARTARIPACRPSISGRGRRSRRAITSCGCATSARCSRCGSTGRRS